MSLFTEALPAVFSSLVFFGYGTLCVFSHHMRLDFQRFGLEKWRMLTGVLEILGALGLLVGLWYTPVYLISAAGLGTLMLLGLLARLKAKDPITQMIPAALLMMLNYYLLLQALKLASA